MTMCLSNSQDDDSMTMRPSKSQDGDGMTICMSKLNSRTQLESQDDDSMTMCLSKSQDDDSMVCFSIEKHGIRRVVGACVRAVLKGACVR
jgi:hypothetical protein